MILEKLSNAFGPVGCEGDVRRVVIEAIGGLVAEWRVDHLGNIIAYQPGTTGSGFKVMGAAHMDEVGFMIDYADENGLLHFVKVGSIDDRVLPAKTVRVGPKRIPGVLAIKPVHLTKPDERNKVLKSDQLVIDIGATSKEQAGKHFKTGDYAVFDTLFEDLGPTVLGKAFDDRAGCGVLIELVRRGPYPFDFYPVFTTMEEIGLRGARVAGFSVMPDAAFVFEGTICDDSPKERDVSPTTRLGHGPAITVADQVVISDRRLVDLLVRTAREAGIPFQLKQPGIGGTDSGAIQAAGEGVPAVTVSVPSRYIHSPVSVLSKDDFRNTVELAAASFDRLTPEILRSR
ncbi:MAG: M42 family metallopeptidase [Kiritimatiellaeota bacterium]|nr:M42 family metallopeptidase [Kiritimatiellota bacterium]